MIIPFIFADKKLFNSTDKNLLKDQNMSMHIMLVFDNTVLTYSPLTKRTGQEKEFKIRQVCPNHTLREKSNEFGVDS